MNKHISYDLEPTVFNVTVLIFMSTDEFGRKPYIARKFSVEARAAELVLALQHKPIIVTSVILWQVNRTACTH